MSLTKEQEEAIPFVIRGSDWAEAFEYSPVPITEVAEVIAAVDGCNDESDWTGVFRLKSGEYLYLSAGCDYTGWDCQAGGSGEVRSTLKDLVWSVVPQDSRERLGLNLEDYK